MQSVLRPEVLVNTSKDDDHLLNGIILCQESGQHAFYRRGSVVHVKSGIYIVDASYKSYGISMDRVPSSIVEVDSFILAKFDTYSVERLVLCERPVNVVKSAICILLKSVLGDVIFLIMQILRLAASPINKMQNLYFRNKVQIYERSAWLVAAESRADNQHSLSATSQYKSQFHGNFILKYRCSFVFLLVRTSQHMVQVSKNLA
jgi:hypothetical protein